MFTHDEKQTIKVILMVIQLADSLLKVIFNGSTVVPSKRTL